MKNNTTAEKTYYVTWQDSSTAQVVKVQTASSELAAVAIAAPRCKCYNRESVKVFTEEDLKQILGKRNSCRCYSGEDVLVYAEEGRDNVKLGSTQFYKSDVEGVSKLLLTLLVYAYDHQPLMILGSTRDFPYLTIKAAAYDVEYAEPYIE